MIVDPKSIAVPETAIDQVTNVDIACLNHLTLLGDGTYVAAFEHTNLVKLLQTYHVTFLEMRARLKKLEDEVLVWKSEV